MFPPTADQPRTAPRSLRVVLRDAADLAIAFVTLESYGLDDIRRPRAAPAVTGAGTTGRSSSGDLSATSSEHFLVRAGDGAPLASTGGDAPLAPTADANRRTAGHPHRPELRVPARLRRPGVALPQKQPCSTPLRVRPQPDQASPPPSSRRRTAPQDTPH